MTNKEKNMLTTIRLAFDDAAEDIAHLNAENAALRVQIVRLETQLAAAGGQR